MESSGDGNGVIRFNGIRDPDRIKSQKIGREERKTEMTLWFIRGVYRSKENFMLSTGEDEFLRFTDT